MFVCSCFFSVFEKKNTTHLLNCTIDFPLYLLISVIICDQSIEYLPLEFENVHITRTCSSQSTYYFVNTTQSILFKNTKHLFKEENKTFSK